jgi:hypothetical protein
MRQVNPEMAASPPVNAIRYAMLIESALAASPPIFVPQAESDDAIQVERGILFPAVLMRAPASVAQSCIDRLVQPGARDLSSYSIVDQLGHRRPAYRGLLVYAALQALRLTDANQPDLENGLRPWAELMAAELARVEWPPDPTESLPAAWGIAATDAAWNGLALYVAANVYAEKQWSDLAIATFNQFVRRQLPGGPFLAARPSDNPETHWYQELVLLHAAASYAIQSRDAAVTAAVARNAEFHFAQTQPDHATNQPWGLPAFMLHPSTQPLADQLLHSATALAGAGGAATSGVTSILLGDALYCLRRLTAVTK